MIKAFKAVALGLSLLLANVCVSYAQDFQKGFGVASSQELSMSIPFQILALSELLDAAYCSRDTYQRFVTAAELPMPKSMAAIAQWAAADSAQEPWFFRLSDASR